MAVNRRGRNNPRCLVDIDGVSLIVWDGNNKSTYLFMQPIYLYYCQAVTHMNLVISRQDAHLFVVVGTVCGKTAHCRCIRVFKR